MFHGVLVGYSVFIPLFFPREKLCGAHSDSPVPLLAALTATFQYVLTCVVSSMKHI